MKEIWKQVKSYEGLYEVSNLGRIKSLAKTWRNGQAMRSKPETILKQFNNTFGYPMITLNKNGKSKNIAVHLLVWDHFGNGLRNGKKIQVDHIDHNKGNARIDNLQLLSLRDNIIKAQKRYRDLPTGVSRHGKKYSAQIQKNRVFYWLGDFLSVEEAKLAHKEAEAVLYNG